MIPKHIVRTLAILRAAYPRWYAEMSAESLAAWGAMMADQDPEALERAAVQYARTVKWPPTVADLIQLARGDISIEDRAQLALTRVKAEQPGDLDPIEREALIAAAGLHWPSHFRAGRYTTDRVVRFEQSYVRIYAAIAKRHAIRAEEDVSARIARALATPALPEVSA